MDESAQVGTDEQFMANVREARENGYNLVCIECGVGVNDPSDIHESRCSYFVNPLRLTLSVPEDKPTEPQWKMIVEPGSPRSYAILYAENKYRCPFTISNEAGDGFYRCVKAPSHTYQNGSAHSYEKADWTDPPSVPEAAETFTATDEVTTSMEESHEQE